MNTIQSFTSAHTSINSVRIPYIYSHINWDKLRGKEVLDYGCGRYTQHIEALMSLYDIRWYGYDPYWRNATLNGEAIHCDPDIVICSNVLNVIKEDLIVSKIHDTIKYAYMPSMGYFIKVYEGNGTGKGKKTKNDCWQRNQLTRDYMYSDEICKCQIITQKGYEDLIISKSII